MSSINAYMPTDVEVAWSAGLFEGEGSITASIQKYDGHVRFVTVVLTMTDEDVVDRFARIMNYGKVHAYYYGPHNKIKYQWQTNKISEVERILELLGPYLGKRRLAKGEELIHRYWMDRV